MQAAVSGFPLPICFNCFCTIAFIFFIGRGYHGTGTTPSKHVSLASFSIFCRTNKAKKLKVENCKIFNRTAATVFKSNKTRKKKKTKNELKKKKKSTLISCFVVQSYGKKKKREMEREREREGGRDKNKNLSENQ